MFTMFNGLNSSNDGNDLAVDTDVYTDEIKEHIDKKESDIIKIIDDRYSNIINHMITLNNNIHQKSNETTEIISNKLDDLQKQMERLDNKYESLQKDMMIIHDKLDKILINSNKMGDHVDFVDNIYETCEKPFWYVMNKMNYFTNGDIQYDNVKKIRNDQ